MTKHIITQLIRVTKMNNERLEQFIKSSFLSPLLDDPDISDITYNGEDIYYLHRYYGRSKSTVNITQTEAYEFLRHIANLSEVQWSVRSPYLDVSVGSMRINGVFTSIGRYKFSKTPTFALRITKDSIIDYEKDQHMPHKLLQLLKLMLQLDRSIIIAGATSSGKTELQKYLISQLPKATRIIVIDNLQELECIRNEKLDLTLWQMQEGGEASYADLIKNALRANPDWLIMAEARGKEMLDGLNCAMSGHPLIMTLHSLHIEAVSSRMTRMVLSSDKNLDYDIVFTDIIHHFPFIIYCKKITTGSNEIIRIVSDVGVYEDGVFHLIYSKKQTDEYYEIPKKLLAKLAQFDDETIKKWEDKK